MNTSVNSNEGIDFREYDCSEDDPIHPRFLGTIAEKIQELITEYDFAFSRLQESVSEFDKHQSRLIAAECDWRRRRDNYGQWANTQHRLKGAAGRPGPQYRCELCSPDIHVWFPWKFWLRNCPRVDWPLPLQDGGMERYEKETILAAIYDLSMKGGRKIADGLALEHFDKLIGIESSKGTEGGVKHIPAKHQYHLERWLRDLEEDLNARTTKHSIDFRSVRWRGKVLAFTIQQAAIVKILWEAKQNGTPDVGKETLLEAIGSEKSRLVDGFRDHPAWKSMIVPGDTKGSLRIADDPPES